MPGPLDGYRIVDLTTMISGPMATCLLGDQGADVIKVEAPGRGDLVRVPGSRRAKGITATFATTNRNKRSIVLDLKAPKAAARSSRRWSRRPTCVVQNFPPGNVAERMGIGFEAAIRRRSSPNSSTCRSRASANPGPYAGKRVYDPLIQALSGLATIQGDRGQGRPSHDATS